MRKLNGIRAFILLNLVVLLTGCPGPASAPKVELTKIEITAQPSKTEYFMGEDFDKTGLAVTATFSDATTKDVTSEVTVSGYDKVKADEQTVTVSYTNGEITKTAEFKVTVKDVEVTKIEITTLPSKTVYLTGAALDTTGMTVTATFSVGTSADVTKEVSVTGFDSSATSDSQTITLTYGGKTATFTVKILAVTKIEITSQPSKTEYFMGEDFDKTGLAVTATFSDTTIKDVTAEAAVTGFDSSAAVESQTITVTYEGKTETFTVKIKYKYLFHDKVTVLPAGTDGSYGTEGTYVEFGDWPKDVVSEEDATTLGLETSTEKIKRGYLEFVKGKDENYYVKCAEWGYKDYFYHDGTKAGTKGENSRWFKVAPIKWRIADTEFKDFTGNVKGKLLIAEHVITGNVPYYEDKDNNRIIDGNTVYPHNYKHSQIRAYLNGYTYTGFDASSTANVKKDQWNNKGFLQTAFGTDAQSTIATTNVDNTAASHKSADNSIKDVGKDYVCEQTDDKIFLLSEYEVTKYSKNPYGAYYGDETRKKEITEFATANNANKELRTYGGWWLRTPKYNYTNQARSVDNYGDAGNYGKQVTSTYITVVPALSISF